MDREIKFREAIFAEPDNRFMGFHYWGWIDGEWVGPESTDPEASKQYICSKDKNGKEIYERDIFRQKGMDGKLIVGTIVFYDDLSYRCREGNYIYHKVKFAGEVIGNIYENPELLEEKVEDG